MLKQFVFFIMLLFMFTAAAIASPIHIVAAENFYGEAAKQIGGPYVQVVSILNHPNQDPHLFSASAATAKAIAQADIIVYNGLEYDPWMENLIAVNKSPKIIIITAHLTNKKTGDNPHLWYDPQTMLLYTQDLTQKLMKLDAVHQAYYEHHLAQFKQDYQKLFAKISQLKNLYPGSPVMATEPVFGYMADALGFPMYGKNFQLSIMNNTSPSARDIKEVEECLHLHQVKVLIYNKQMSNPVTQRVQVLAKQSGIPLVGVSETQPVNQDYVMWMKGQLDSLEKALSHDRG